MAKTVTITAGLLDKLHVLNILPKFNAEAPRNGSYGWIHEGDELRFREPVQIEENVGIYGGAYKPLPGGKKSHGFASVGAFTYSFSPLPEGLRIGRYCSISKGLRFLDSNHPLDTITTSAAMFRPKNELFKHTRTEQLREFASEFSVAPDAYPVIGHDVWIGSDVTLAASVKIGTGSVIASGSLVTKDVPPYAIVGGNPATLIRFRFDQDIVHALRESEWWDYEPKQVFANDPRDIEGILARVKAGGLRRYRPKSITLGA